MNFDIKNNKKYWNIKFFSMKRLSLNKKIFFYFVIQIIIVFILVNITVPNIIINNLINLERDRMKAEISRMINELDNQLQMIKQTIHDYSEWDDMNNYVTDKSNNYDTNTWMKFERDNLSGISMQGIDMDIIMVVDNDANIIYKRSYDESVISQDNIPKELQDYVLNKQFINNLDKADEIHGIMYTEEGLYFVGIHPILNTLGEGPKNGAMIMARKIDENKSLKFIPKFTIEVLNNDNKLIEGNGYLNTKNLKNPYIYISEISGSLPKIDAYSFIPDLTGEKVIKLDLKTDESFTKKISMIEYLFLGIFTVYLISIVITWYFLYENFVFRINHILKSISKLKSNRNEDFIKEELETNDELQIVEKKIEELIDELNNHYEELIYSVTTDSLTKLYNRVGFNNEIQKYIKSIENKNVRAALLFLDIDKFKNVNDVYGHNIGDELLEQFAKRICDNAPKNSIVARTSGDEFIMFIKEYESKEYIHNLVNELVKILNHPYHIKDYKIKSTASIGMAFYPESSDNIEEIIIQADIAMYNVKKSGRNNFTEYKSEMKNIITGISITNAIENDEFYLEYQPQINANTQELVGLESLLRWDNPILGTVPPNKFISIAEDTGTINELGMYVIEKVFKQIKEWQDKGYNVPKVSINISPIQLINKNLYKEVMDLIIKYNLNTDRITFEITENIGIDSQNEIFENLNCLHVSGIDIYIDDFGKGYSALNYLEMLPITGVKIDKSFVDHIEKNDKIIKMVFALSKALNLDVVVEGVETKVQEEKICKMGGCIIQGYLYSKPISKDEIETKYLK